MRATWRWVDNHLFDVSIDDDGVETLTPVRDLRPDAPVPAPEDAPASTTGGLA